MRSHDRPAWVVRQLLIIGCMALVIEAAPAWAQQATSAPAAAQRTVDPPSANELAKEISNPVTSIWQLQLQFNNIRLETSDTPVSDEWVNNLYFQPVMPLKLTDGMNLVTRPVMTLYNSVPYPTGASSSARKTDLGDTILAQVFSPSGTEPWIYGVGPTWIFPTAGADIVGQGKWQVGPAFGAGYITNKFMVAAFGQQWWSFAGGEDRASTNQMQILPLVYRFFGDGWSVGYSGTIYADFKADSGERWTVPLGMSLGKVVKFGMLPVQVQAGGQYFAEKPTAGPKWNVQLQVTPVIPRLIKGTLF